MLDNLDELPDSWTWVKTGDVCEGLVPVRTKPKNFGGDIPWITLPDIEGLYVLKSKKDLAVATEEAEAVGMKVMPTNTVLISCVGQFGMVCIALNPVVPNQQLHGFVCLQQILPEYVAYALKMQVNQMEQMASATTISYLNKTKCNSISFPLAPLNEQRRIVSTIEQLTDRSHKARTALEDVPKLIAQFRQSVLAAAFRGDLTADWREKNPDIEPAPELLERIRQTLPKAAQKKIEDELSDPFDIPDRWTWANLSNVCWSISDGDHQPPPKANSGIPFLTISNISSGIIDFSNTYYVPESYYEKIQDNKKARKGDIIYSVVGSYGIPVLINSDREFCFQRHIAILKPHQNLISKYLLFALKSRFVFDQATKVATGTTQLTVTLSGLRRIKIPLISVSEQILIVERIENLFKMIDRIEE
jgi:type I restriction enzyme, S subunit